MVVQSCPHSFCYSSCSEARTGSFIFTLSLLALDPSFGLPKRVCQKWIIGNLKMRRHLGSLAFSFWFHWEGALFTKTSFGSSWTYFWDLSSRMLIQIWESSWKPSQTHQFLFFLALFWWAVTVQPFETSWSQSLFWISWHHRWTQKGPQPRFNECLRQRDLCQRFTLKETGSSWWSSSPSSLNPWGFVAIDPKSLIRCKQGHQSDHHTLWHLRARSSLKFHPKARLLKTQRAFLLRTLFIRKPRSYCRLAAVQINSQTFWKTKMVWSNQVCPKS